MTSTTTDVVIAYAKRFGRLLPLCWLADGECGCGRGHEWRYVGKASLTQRGWHDASTRPGQLKFWLQQYPLANWGLALADGYVVVNPDSAEALSEAQERGLPPTVVRKSSNPAYLYLRPEGCEITNATKRGRSRKLDLLATECLVVLGEHANGAQIEMVGDELAVAPAWCCEPLSRQKAPPGLQPRESPTGEPPVVLNESGIQLWHGEVVVGPTGKTLRRADNQAFDRSEMLFALGRSLANAGLDALFKEVKMSIKIEVIPKSEGSNPTLSRLVRTALAEDNNAARALADSEQRDSDPSKEEEAIEF